MTGNVRRKLINVVALLAIAFSLSVPTALAAPPVRSINGGTLTNPCNGHAMSYDAVGSTWIRGKVTIHWERGTGLDQVTGETYRFALSSDVIGIPFVDPIWSSRSTMVFVGRDDWFIIRDFTSTNLIANPPIIVPNDPRTTCGRRPAPA